MKRWTKSISIKYLFTKKEDYKSIQKCMNAIADVIDDSKLIPPFNTEKFRKIPKGDDFFKPVDYANKLLNLWYDYADIHGIWTE